MGIPLSTIQITIKLLTHMEINGWSG